MDKRFYFSFSSSIKTPAQMQPCSPELLNAAMDSQQVANTCHEIAASLAQVKEGTLTREAFESLKSQLKADNLPVVCFHATFSDGYRHNQSAVPSGLSIYDIDHLQEDPRAYYFNKVAGREVELGISFAHVSPSNEGIRLVFEMPKGMSLAEAQQWMADQLGDDTYDGCVKDMARCSFVVCRDYVLYYDEEELFAEREVNVPENPVTMGTKDNGVSAPLLPPAADEVFEDNFNGISYQHIVRAMEELLGGVPAQGARNNFIFAMACHLRYVCNDDARWISQVLPRYGEEEVKYQSTVRSACNRPQTKSVPDVVTRALEMARKQQQVDEAIEANGVHAPQPPVMPLRLTKFMRLITKNVPEHLRPAVAMGMFPSLGAHCKGVKFRYNDNALVEPTFMNVLVAEMSSGKSCVNEPINAIMADIKEKDAKNRKLMQEYKEQYDTCPADEQKPERPKGLSIQWVKSDMTPAAFVQLMADAGGRFLYTRMDEIGMLNQLKTNGKGNNVTEILRLAFDCGEYGQERVGTQSVKARTTLRMNMVFATTPNTAKMYLGKNIGNGTLSRLSLSTIVKEDVERRPKFKQYDEAFDKKLAVFLARLENVKGAIVCPQAKRLAEALLDRAEERALMMGNESYEQLSYRAVEIAFRKSILLYVMNGMKWSKEIDDLVTYLFDYDMWVKMCLFGEEITNKLAKDNRVMKPGVPCLLELLNDSFTRQEFDILYKAQNATIGNISKAASNLLSQWKKRGWIEENVEQGIYVKTEAYYQKHAA